MATIAVGQRDGSSPARRTGARSTACSCASSSSATGCSPRTRSATSGARVRRAPAGGSPPPATRSSRSCLEYGGLTPQPLFVMGRTDGIERRSSSDVVRPRAAYVAAKARVLPAVAQHYRIEPGPDDDPDVGRPVAVPAVAGPRSSASCRSRWASSTASTSSGSPRGCRRAPSPRASTTASASTASLVAAAGTHVISRRRRPGRRRQRADAHRPPRPRLRQGGDVSAVTAELLRYCDQVVLNVRSDNPPAIAGYRRLGYPRTLPVRGAAAPPHDPALGRPHRAVPAAVRARRAPGGRRLRHAQRPSEHARGPVNHDQAPPVRPAVRPTARPRNPR